MGATSTRERRLWLAAAIVVVGIYATLGLARTLEAELRDRNLLDAVFLWGFGLAIAAVVAFALRVRPRGIEIAVGLGIVAVYVMAFVRLALPEERTHLIEYGVVGVLVYEALLERADNGRPVPAPAVTALGLTAAAGTLDELIQAVIPSRVFDPVDIGVNILAGALAIGARLALGRASTISRWLRWPP